MRENENPQANGPFKDPTIYYKEIADIARLEVQRCLHSKKANYAVQNFLIFNLNFNYSSCYIKLSDYDKKKIKTQILDTEREIYKVDSQKRENFEFYRTLNFDEVPENRYPAQGITLLPFKYHTGRVVKATDKIPETGYFIKGSILRLITRSYPTYLPIVESLCRPLGTTDATFNDFNKNQEPTDVLNQKLKDHILHRHIYPILNFKKYKPIHPHDFQFCALPLNTGTGYYNRYSIEARATAKLHHPAVYDNQTTCKGYFVNINEYFHRQIIENIQKYGCIEPIHNPNKEVYERVKNMKNKQFFLSHPTLMFTRNHVSPSDREGELKQRPVYCVDDLFLRIEAALAFPLLIQARDELSAIMQGLETMRGANCYLDTISQTYKTYFTIDYKSFDQTIPLKLVTLLFSDVIPDLAIVNLGYTKKWGDLDNKEHQDIAQGFQNLLKFMEQWMTEMTFVTGDGFAYKREHAGIPSGMLFTQVNDSIVNLFMIIDSLIAYGCTDDEIDQMKFFIMGDDNCIFSQWPMQKIERFSLFLPEYLHSRWKTYTHPDKNILTSDRRKISTLSYECNQGYPVRPIEKMVAQLVYPERGFDEKLMSYRAIGAAYASSGCNKQFYEFCKDIYNMYLPDRAPINEFNIRKIKKMMYHGYYDDESFITDEMLEEFPTFGRILFMHRAYLGPLHPGPKWKFDVFREMPYCNDKRGITLTLRNEAMKFLSPPLSPRFNFKVND
ncbi:MAG: RNA-dependent RNA polymerase [Guiyang partitivirus 1]|nr:MAG: RNA-dependent RNA polymerase [Guiyang partitivirus 1]